MRAATTDRSVKAVMLCRGGRTITVQPACQAILGVLKTYRNFLAPTPDGRSRIRPVPEPLYEETSLGSDTELCIPSGLEPVVRELLRRSESSCRVKGGLPPLPAADRSL